MSGADGDRRNLAAAKVKERVWPEPYGKPTDIDCVIGLEKIRNRRFYQITRPETEAIFEYFDLDKDKYISVFEIKALLDIVCTVKSEEGEQVYDAELIDDLDIIFGQGDSSGDGVIDMDEFLQAMKLSSSAEAAKTTLRSAEPRRHAWAKRKNVIVYLEASFAQAESCQSLPFYMVFFCLSFYLVVNHLRILSGFNEVQLGRSAWMLPEDGGETWYPKNFMTMYDLNTGPMKWAESDLLPNRLNYGDDHPFRGRVSNYQQIVGGLVFTRTNAPNARCRDSELENLYLPAKLAGYDPATAEATLGFTTPAPPPLEELCLDMEATEEETYFVPSTPLMDLLTMQTAILNKQGQNWLDRKSTKLKIQAFTYNADNGYFQINSITFELTAGGAIEVTYNFQNFLAKPYDSKGISGQTLRMLDAIWFGMVGYVLLRETFHILRDVKRLGLKTAIGHYFNMYNVIDWFNIIMSILIVTNWDGILDYMGALEELVENLPEYNSFNTDLQDTTEQIHEMAETVSANYGTMKWRISIFAASTMLSFFKAFRANPRLDVVAKTLSGASMDLAHFLIVFTTIFSVFVLVGHFLFGSSVVEFSTITRSQNSCFLCMMGFLYDDIADSCRAEAGNLSTVYWLLFFMVIAVLLMNMILAIIFDVYTEVKNDAGDAAYLWTQVIEAIQYQKNRLELLKQAAHYVTEMGADLAGVESADHKVNQGRKPLNRMWIYRRLHEDNAHPDDIMTPGSMAKEWNNRHTLASNTMLLKDVEEYVRHLRVKADVDVDDVMRVLGRMDMNIRDMMARARFEFGDPMLVNRKTQQFEQEIDFVLRKLGADPDEIAMNAGLLNKHPKTLAQMDNDMGLMAEEYEPTAEEIAKMNDASAVLQTAASARRRPKAAGAQMGMGNQGGPPLLPGLQRMGRATSGSGEVDPRYIPKGATDSYGRQ